MEDPDSFALSGESVTGPIVDMGAFEYQVSPTPACEGDLNGDFTVGTSDLLTLLGAWGPCR